MNPIKSDPSAITWHGHMADDVGATYGHEPLAKLVADQHLLILEGTRGSFQLPRVAVTRVGRGKLYPWFFSAVRIHHNVVMFPRELQFKPLEGKPSDVLQRLREMGYPVS